MARYILSRLSGLLGVLVAVSAITFFLMHAIPGGPFDTMGGDKGPPLPPGVRQQLNHLYGLDKPIFQQYLTFLGNAARLDFGYSFMYTNRTITEIFRDQLPYSMHLAALTLAFSTLVGLTLGILAAFKEGTWIDYSSTLISLFSMVVPSFVFAILMQFVFSVKLGWLPTGGWDHPNQWIMPVLANSLGPLAILQRYTRSSMIDAIRSNYVRTARAKGLSEKRVILVHVLKNALTPLITVGGPMAAGLVTGSFFVESIFRIPGIGSYWVAGIGNRDYPMVMATTLMWTALISVTYLLTDLAYAMIDPRVTYVKEK